MKTKLFIFILLLTSSMSFAQWQSLSTGIFSGDSFDVAITSDKNGVPYMVYSGMLDGLVHVQKYENNTWTDVGSNATGVVIPKLLAIAIHPTTNQPWVAYRNNTTKKVDVIKFNGTSWANDTTSLTSFDPQKKIVLKFGDNGDLLLGTQNYSREIASEFYLYSKRNTGTWVKEFNSEIYSAAFDISASNRFVIGKSINHSTPGYFKAQARVYKYEDNTWSFLRLNSIPLANTEKGYITSIGGAKDEAFYGYYKKNMYNTRVADKMYLHSSVSPINANRPKKDVCELLYSNLNYNYYGLFIDNSQKLQIQKYNPFLHVWKNTDINLTINDTSPKVKLAISPSGKHLFVAYLDNKKVNVKKLTIATPPKIAYVDKSATAGNNDGSSWANAYVDLQTAIDSVSPPTKIWVAKGTYKPSGTARNSTFKIEAKYQEIYGGFSGNETTLAQRDVKNNVTILSGDLSGNDNVTITDDESTRSDNAYHVVSFKKSSSGSILDGFTITGANANGGIDNNCNSGNNQFLNNTGGAIYVQPYDKGTIKVTIKNCILEKNTALKSSVLGSFNPCGQQNIVSDVDFVSCIIKNNYSKDDAAISFLGSQRYGQYQRGSIVNSLVVNNTSTNSASCLHLYTSSSGTTAGIDVEIINSTFSNNTGKDGTVINMTRANNSKIINSIIYGNGSIIPFTIDNGGSVVSNSIVQGGQSGGSNANPLFVDVSNDNYALQSNSPAINRGNTSKVPTTLKRDLLGKNRIHDNVVDMGAYEFGAADYIPRKLTLNSSQQGKVTISPTSSDSIFVNGSTVTLTAQATSNDYQFDRWSGDASGTTNPLTVTMDADKSINAVFTKKRFKLNITANNGTVQMMPQSADSTYEIGTVVKLVHKANEGLKFVNWSTGSAEDTLKVTMNGNKSIKAVFAKFFNLTIKQPNDSLGKIIVLKNNTVATETMFKEGTTLTLKMNFKIANYQVKQWTDSLEGKTNINENLKMNSDKVVGIQIIRAKRKLEVQTNSLGTITINPSSADSLYNHGTEVTLTATPKEGYVFFKWTGTLEGKTENPIKYTLNANATIGAKYIIPCTDAVNIPDAKFKKYLLENTNINKNGDSVICKDEASGFTGKILVGGKGIEDLTGIEAFTSIKGLQAFNNKITRLDLSKNTKLEQILIEKNTITSINISMLPKVKDFKAHSNNLTYLNLANGNNTNFTRVDVRSNTSLGCIQIDNNFTPSTSWNKDSRANWNNKSCGTEPAIYKVSLENMTNGSVTLNKNSGEAGTEITATATPAEGYKFSKWTGVLAGKTGNPAKFTLNADVTVGAAFIKIGEAVTYDVTISQTTNGTVKVDKSSGEAGTEITATATPAEGYKFSKWTGALEGKIENPIKFTLNADVTVGAKFVKILKVTVSETTNGTVSVDRTSGIAGTKIIATATPAKGYNFSKWTGALAGQTTNPAIFTLKSDATVGAEFVKILKVTVSEITNGTVKVNRKSGVAGTEITATATPAAGYKFVKWTGALAGKTANPAKFTLNADATVGAEFELLVVAKPLGLEDEQTFVVSPNPMANSVMVTSETQEGVVFYTLSGREVLRGMTNQQINVSKLAKGMYTIKVGGQTFKVIKR